MTLFKPGLNMVYLTGSANCSQRFRMQPRSANRSLTSASKSTPFIKGNKFNVWRPCRRRRGRSSNPSLQTLPSPQQAAPGAGAGADKPPQGWVRQPSSGAGGGAGSMLLRHLLLWREPSKVLVRSSHRMWKAAQIKMLAWCRLKN